MWCNSKHNWNKKQKKKRRITVVVSRPWHFQDEFWMIKYWIKLKIILCWSSSIRMHHRSSFFFFICINRFIGHSRIVFRIYQYSITEKNCPKRVASYANHKSFSKEKKKRHLLRERRSFFVFIFFSHFLQVTRNALN